MVHGRYAFKSPEQVALQEIGPRFTLKLRWLKRGLPTLHHFGESPKPLQFDIDVTKTDHPDHTAVGGLNGVMQPEGAKGGENGIAQSDDYLWIHKVSRNL